MKIKGLLATIRNNVLTLTRIAHGCILGLVVGLFLGSFIPGSYIAVSIILVGPISSLYTGAINWELMGQYPKVGIIPPISAGVIAGMSYGLIYGILSGDLFGSAILAGLGGGSGAAITQLSIHLARRFTPEKYRLLPELIPTIIIAPIILLFAGLCSLVFFAILAIWILNELMF